MMSHGGNHSGNDGGRCNRMPRQSGNYNRKERLATPFPTERRNYVKGRNSTKQNLGRSREGVDQRAGTL
ncbi:hypothetical protein BHE74_00049990 [Ensete ventricosum]|nr:hypothetical protein BHE74_00049990 [Ensete ventricosum]RZS03227.1 hypothetical protein BHM03_00033373 [Ensete ventricosum]